MRLYALGRAILRANPDLLPVFMPGAGQSRPIDVDAIGCETGARPIDVGNDMEIAAAISLGEGRRPQPL